MAYRGCRHDMVGLRQVEQLWQAACATCGMFWERREGHWVLVARPEFLGIYSEYLEPPPRLEKQIQEFLIRESLKEAA